MAPDDGVGAFRSVDSANDPDSLVKTMDMMDQHQLVHEARALIRKWLNPRPGDVTLDVGCGTGTEVREYARMVAPAGNAIGIDSSETMINEARRRSQGLNLPAEFRVADAAALPFEDNTFSGCRAERIFQHVSDRRRLLSELRRVVRKGARIAVSDADWGSATLDTPNKDLTRKILNFFCDSVTNGWMGRQHRRLFMEAGLTSVEVHPQVFIYKTWAELDAWGFGRSLENAVKENVISSREKDQWLADAMLADRNDRFFYSVCQFVVSGVKP